MELNAVAIGSRIKSIRINLGVTLDELLTVEDDKKSPHCNADHK